jgi:hypothetical protein
MERIANQIECGEFSFDPETQIVFMQRDLIANPQACQHVQILPDGRLRFFFLYAGGFSVTSLPLQQIPAG